MGAGGGPGGRGCPLPPPAHTQAHRHGSGWTGWTVVAPLIFLLCSPLPPTPFARRLPAMPLRVFPCPPVMLFACLLLFPSLLGVCLCLVIFCRRTRRPIRRPICRPIFSSRKSLYKKIGPGIGRGIGPEFFARRLGRWIWKLFWIGWGGA